MSDDKNLQDMIAEGYRLNQNYAEFDRFIKEEFGGSLEDMTEWVFSVEARDSFKSKWLHDAFVTDFNRWMRNRGILNE